MANFVNTNSCSLLHLTVTQLDDKKSIEKVVKGIDKTDSNGSICLLRPIEIKLEPILLELGYRFVDEFKRCHDPDNIRLYFRKREVK